MSDRTFDCWALRVHVLALLIAVACLFWAGSQAPLPVLFALYPVGVVLGATLARVGSDLLECRAARRPAAE